MDTELNKSKVSTVPDLRLIIRSQENQRFTGIIVSKSVYSSDQIKKNQFDLSALYLPPARTPQVWEAVLATWR